MLGFCQSLWLIMRTRPDAIFIKGGYVGVPLGLAAALFRVPFITHDSDTVPGLANRIVGRWARMHATGMPTEYYRYPKSKMRFTGTPVGPEFQAVTDEIQKSAKRELGIDEQMRVILVTGGSLGAQRINQVVKSMAPDLLEKHSNLFLIHQVGQANKDIYGDYIHPRLRAETFIDKFYVTSAAADLVVARGSATTISQLSIQAKPTILIPSPFLAGGHQLKNAKVLEEQGAAVVLQEKELLDQPTLLTASIEELLDNDEVRQKLSVAISGLAKPEAAREISKLILEIQK